MSIEAPRLVHPVPQSLAKPAADPATEQLFARARAMLAPAHHAELARVQALAAAPADAAALRNFLAKAAASVAAAAPVAPPPPSLPSMPQFPDLQRYFSFKAADVEVLPTEWFTATQCRQSIVDHKSGRSISVMFTSAATRWTPGDQLNHARMPFRAAVKFSGFPLPFIQEVCAMSAAAFAALGDETGAALLRRNAQDPRSKTALEVYCELDSTVRNDGLVVTPLFEKASYEVFLRRFGAALAGRNRDKSNAPSLFQVDWSLRAMGVAPLGPDSA